MNKNFAFHSYQLSTTFRCHRNFIHSLRQFMTCATSSSVIKPKFFTQPSAFVHHNDNWITFHFEPLLQLFICSPSNQQPFRFLFLLLLLHPQHHGFVHSVARPRLQDMIRYVKIEKSVSNPSFRYYKICQDWKYATSKKGFTQFTDPVSRPLHSSPFSWHSLGCHHPPLKYFFID